MLYHLSYRPKINQASAIALSPNRSKKHRFRIAPALASEPETP
jgi:hypothetical protein